MQQLFKDLKPDASRTSSPRWRSTARGLSGRAWSKDFVDCKNGRKPIV
jgi:hypothetical protein